MAHMAAKDVEAKWSLHLKDVATLRVCVCETTSHNTQKNKALLIPIFHCFTVKWQESRVKPLHFGTAGEKLPALPETDHSKYKCFGRGLGHI